MMDIQFLAQGLHILSIQKMVAVLENIIIVTAAVTCVHKARVTLN